MKTHFTYYTDADLYACRSLSAGNTSEYGQCGPTVRRHAGFAASHRAFGLHGAEGFEVVGGKIGRALNQFTIAGNIYDFLQDIEAVGNDLDLSQRSVASPSLLVKNLTAAGS